MQVSYFSLSKLKNCPRTQLGRKSVFVETQTNFRSQLFVGFHSHWTGVVKDALEECEVMIVIINSFIRIKFEAIHEM